MKSARGLVIVNTGKGKGKTTAALGMMLRAWGNGLRAVMVQFVKSSKSDYGEHKAARRIGLEILTAGAGFTFASKDMSAHRDLAVSQWQVARARISSGDYDMVVLDELTYPLKYGWIDTGEVIEVLRQRPSGVHVIITGREAPEALTDYADTVVEITDVKHHLRQGIKAQPGIEL